MGSNRNQEVEIKLRVTDISALRRRLNQLRAQIVSPRTHEYNTLYDTPKGDLARRGQLIRIRIERAPSESGRNAHLRSSKAILTYKGPSQSARSLQPTIDKPARKGRYKVREEVEVAISNGEQMRQILTALGLRSLFCYEKFRTTYTLPGIRNLKIDLDETPIGTFLELEGAPPDIDRVAKRLGYSRSDYITRTYGALYIADSLRLARKPTDMLFRATKNCANTHSFLDKKFNSVYLLCGRFFAGSGSTLHLKRGARQNADMKESAEQEPFPSSSQVATLCSRLAQRNTSRKPMRREGCGLRLELARTWIGSRTRLG